MGAGTDSDQRSESGPRRRSKWERRQVVEETFQPGASVALIARAHGVNANQVFHWRKLYKLGLLGTNVESAELLPVRISQVREAAPERTETKTADGTIHVELGSVRVRIEGAADPESIRATLTALGSMYR